MTKTELKTRKLVVTLEIEVAPLGDDELADAGFFEYADEDGDSAPYSLQDYEASDLGALIPYAIEHPDNEMFAGSEIFAKIADVRVLSSEWLERVND